MTTYKELLEQRASLELKIKEAHANENAEAISKVRALVTEYELTTTDVFPTMKLRGRKPGEIGPKSKVVAKYRDPATGVTWSGRGKPPRWIAGQDRSQFTI
jgi:DNA-binding protein H-NS